MPATDPNPEFNDLLLVLGMATGLILRGDNYARLVASLQAGIQADGVHPAFVRALRDRLDCALREAGMEKAHA